MSIPSVSIPSFMKKDPPMTTPAAPSLTPMSPVEAANALGNTVAQLIAERDHLREELRLSRLHNETLAATLDRAERDRDHYEGKAKYFERFSMGVVTNFNTIRMIVDDTQRKANEFAKTDTKPAQEAPPEAPATDHANALAASILGETQFGETK